MYSSSAHSQQCDSRFDETSHLLRCYTSASDGSCGTSHGQVSNSDGLPGMGGLGKASGVNSIQSLKRINVHSCFMQYCDGSQFTHLSDLYRSHIMPLSHVAAL